MLLIDTNVISESRKVRAGRAAPEVVAWLEATDSSTTFVSAMSIFELELGVVRVERRDPAQGKSLRQWLEVTVKRGFSGRVLAMDSAIAIACARLHVPDPVSERDAWIASTALVHSLTLVTRNVADFERTGVPIINPWEPLP